MVHANWERSTELEEAAIASSVRTCLKMREMVGAARLPVETAHVYQRGIGRGGVPIGKPQSLALERTRLTGLELRSQVFSTQKPGTSEVFTVRFPIYT